MSNHDREGNGDATLDRAWRQASDERPPSQLDAAIIAAAREAFRDRDDAVKTTHAGRGSRNWLTGWQPLATAAGVIGLAFVLVQSLPRDVDLAPSIPIEEAASGPARTRDHAPGVPAREGRGEKAAVAAAPASAEVPAIAADSDDIERAVPAPPSPPASTPRAESSARALDKDSSVGGTAAMHATEVDQRQTTVPEMSTQAESEAVAAPAEARLNVAPLSAGDWAARVEARYTAGDVAGAADTLRAFREAVSDADGYLPDSLRDWARTVEGSAGRR